MMSANPFSMPSFAGMFVVAAIAGRPLAQLCNHMRSGLSDQQHGAFAAPPGLKRLNCSADFVH
jgi:hypothetical protein